MDFLIRLNHFKVRFMQKILLFFTLLGSYSAFCQSLSPQGIFASGGVTNIDGYAQLSWTLGETQTLTYSKNNVILTQGFLQSNFTITGIDAFSENDIVQYSVFPNPVKDILTMEYSADKEIELSVYLYNLEGKSLFTNKISTSTKSSEINFTSLQSGYYILKVFTEDQSFLKTYKILFQK